MFRITSYNVCYTKLLRASAIGTLARKISSTPRARSVITSYSIHYTKLYDAGVPPTFCALQWHNDSFDLPPGATHLAGSRDCPVQAFRYRNAWAVQFHPEVDAGVVAEWNRRLKEPGDYPREFEAARTDS